MSPGPVRVGVIGLGFMGRTHVAAYRRAYAAGYPVEIVAVCDKHPERLLSGKPAGGNLATGAEGPLIDPETTRLYDDPARLLADPGVDLVSVCTPTDTHVEMGLAVIAAGKHSLIEKPFALDVAGATCLAEAARASERVCMPAMCMRFWPAWSWLKDAAESGLFGAIRSATFTRVGSPPAWADFYTDESRSGGGHTDVHIHDADFVRFLLGQPRAVHAVGSTRHATTTYRYDDVAHVTAEGGWAHPSGFGYRMRYCVAFERATADFDLAGWPELAPTMNGASRAAMPQLRLCTAHGAEAVDLPAGDGYDWQIRHLIDAVASKAGRVAVTPDDAVGTIRLLEAERQSLRTGREIRLG